MAAVSAEEGQRAGETMLTPTPWVIEDHRGECGGPWDRMTINSIEPGIRDIVVCVMNKNMPNCERDAKLIVTAVNSHSTLTTENARLTERVKVLEAALKPFAVVCEMWDRLRKGPIDEKYDGVSPTISYGDLLRARTTLTHGEGK